MQNLISVLCAFGPLLLAGILIMPHYNKSQGIVRKTYWIGIAIVGSIVMVYLSMNLVKPALLNLL